MCLIRLTTTGLVATVLSAFGAGDQQPSVANSPSVEGTWIITSAQRDGKADPAQVGEKMVFKDTEVKFVPKKGAFPVTSPIKLG